MKDDFDPSGPARADSGIFGIGSDLETAGVRLVPVGFDATTSYRSGASKGPAAILAASPQLDLFDVETGRPYEAGIVMLPESKKVRRLNRAAGKAAKEARVAEDAVERDRLVSIVNESCEDLNEVVRGMCEEGLAAGRLVGLVGGDHAAPYGFIAALAERHRGMGILHFDAHHDLRAAFEGFTWSHASIMYNVMTQLDGVAKLVQVGTRDFCEEERRMIDGSDRRIVSHEDSAIARARYRGATFDEIARAIVDGLPAEVYVSFDIDGLDPRFCPNTGTPVPGGLDFNEAIHILRTLTQSGRRIIGFDLCEVAPGKDDWDGNVGARILYKLIGFALMSRR